MLKRPAATSEEWMAEANAYKGPLNPLEGLPGIDSKNFNPKFGRKTEPE
ncbi:hypothetical protein U91I_01598 [alpha proteobacterium U9-1i]|nr:hypothetical protein U91I_01598 [alpha proteobacterium U9-1i]